MKALPTILTAAIVSFGVATVASPAAKAPPTHGIALPALSSTSAPSDHDRLVALAKRVDTLQIQQSIDKQNIRILVNAINQADQDIADVQNAMPCIDGGYQATWNDAGQLVASNGPVDESTFFVATFSAECGS